VPSHIVDAAYPTDDYGIERVEFFPGLQTLDGERALEYARTRHADSDFGRMRRQQQIILALRQQLLQPRALAAAPSIVRACWNTTTDLSLTDVVALARTAQSIDTTHIVTAALDENDVRPLTTSQGAQVLVANWPRVRARVASVFGDASATVARTR